MHDLNNVLHLIGTGVYHASTQLGEEREWAYGFCEMLSRKPWGSEFLFRCRVIIYIILWWHTWVGFHVRSCAQSGFATKIYASPNGSHGLKCTFFGRRANTWIARLWYQCPAVWKTCICINNPCLPGMGATNRSDISFFQPSSMIRYPQGRDRAFSIARQSSSSISFERLKCHHVHCRMVSKESKNAYCIYIYIYLCVYTYKYV